MQRDGKPAQEEIPPGSPTGTRRQLLRGAAAATAAALGARPMSQVEGQVAPDRGRLTTSDVTNSTARANAAVARRYLEGPHSGDEAVFDQLLTADCALYGGDHALRARGRDAVKARILEDGRESRAFSDVKMEILEVITRGEKVVVRWKASGTHTGTLKGIRPTGKRVTVGGSTFPGSLRAVLQRSDTSTTRWTCTSSSTWSAPNGVSRGAPDQIAFTVDHTSTHR